MSEKDRIAKQPARVGSDIELDSVSSPRDLALLVSEVAKIDNSKFIIDDFRFRLLKQSAEWSGPGVLHSQSKLVEMIKHPDLFEKYPELKKIKVGILAEANPAGAQWDEGGSHIFINRKLEGRELASKLLHEIQHARDSIDGVAMGGNDSGEFTRTVLNILKKRSDDSRVTLAEWSKRNVVAIDEIKNVREDLNYLRAYKFCLDLRAYALSPNPSKYKNNIFAAAGKLNNVIGSTGGGVGYTPVQAEEVTRLCYEVPRRVITNEHKDKLATLALETAKLHRRVIPDSVFDELDRDSNPVNVKIRKLTDRLSQLWDVVDKTEEWEKAYSVHSSRYKKTKALRPFEIYENLFGEIRARTAEYFFANEEDRESMSDPTKIPEGDIIEMTLVEYKKMVVLEKAALEKVTSECGKFKGDLQAAISRNEFNKKFNTEIDVPSRPQFTTPVR